MVQQSNSWTSIIGKPYFEELHAFQCSNQHYLQYPRLVSNLNVHGLMNGLRIPIVVQWHFSQN